MGIGSVFMFRVSDYGEGQEDEECGYEIPEEDHYLDSRERSKSVLPTRTTGTDHSLGAAKVQSFLAARFWATDVDVHFNIQ
jgi:hypothetical protein